MKSFFQRSRIDGSGKERDISKIMILTLCERLDLDQSGKDIILASKEDWVWMESVLSSLGQSSSSERKQLEYLPMGNTPSSKKSGIDFSSPLSNQHGSSKMKSPSSSPARKTTKSPSSTPSTIQYALKTRPFLGDPSPVPIDDFRGNQTQRSFRSPSAASNTTRSPVASASSKSSAKQQSTPKAALQSYTSHRQQSDDKSPFEADVYVVAEFTKSTSPSSKLIKKASPSAAKSRPRISFQNREVVPLQPHELQEEGPPRSAQASPNRPSKSTTNSPQKQCELAMLSSMDPIRRELFRRLSNSPEKRRSTAAASSTTTEEATFVQIPTARTVIPFGSKRKHPQHKIEEEQDEGFIQIPKFASAPTKTSSSPARQTLPTIEFGQGDSKKVFVHPNASASIDSEPEYLSEDSESEDSDVAVIAEIKLGRQSSSFFVHLIIHLISFLVYDFSSVSV